MKESKVLIVTNSYPSKANRFNQLFVKKMRDELEIVGVDIQVSYSRIYDLWGNANKKKGQLLALIKLFIQAFGLAIDLVFKHRKADVLFTQGILFSTTLSVIFNKIFFGGKKGIVCYIHGGDINKYYETDTFYERILEWSLKNSDRVIANSVDIQNKALKYILLENVDVISPGVDLNLFTKNTEKEMSNFKEDSSIPNSKTILLVAGNAIERKGFEILLNSLALVSNDVRIQLYCIMLVDGPLKDKYFDLIKILNLEDVVSIRSKVPHDDLRKYYSCSDVFVIPSLEEPLGLVGLEAMACGSFVIGSATGGIKEYIENGINGLLFEVANQVDLKEKIEEYFKLRSEGKIQNDYSSILENHGVNKSALRLQGIFNHLTAR